MRHALGYRNAGDHELGAMLLDDRSRGAEPRPPSSAGARALAVVDQQPMALLDGHQIDVVAFKCVLVTMYLDVYVSTLVYKGTWTPCSKRCRTRAGGRCSRH